MIDTAKNENGASICSGFVKWYDAIRGFGFIYSHKFGSDVFVGSQCVRAFGRVYLPEGCRVTVTVTEGRNGLKAVEILEVDEGGHTASASPEAAEERISREAAAGTNENPLLPARVKWFDRTKGFGFLNIFGLAADVFIHMEVVRQSGAQTLLDGEAVACRIERGERGLVAVGIRPWEAAIAERTAQRSSQGGDPGS
ncbi:MAG: cold shock domain-containing protein [Pseudomonadota bacterium]